jgi:RimJ/RimL family protein N-acetyltransferase
VPSRWQRSRGPIRPTVASSTPTTSASATTHRQRLLAIDDDAEFVGTVASFTMEGEREVSYWIDPARWGQGLASRALRAFLAIEPTRPIYGRVAHHNAASAKVLARAGFVEVGSETAFAPGVGAEIVERIYRLDH